jgi:hypothetical protein
MITSKEWEICQVLDATKSTNNKMKKFPSEHFKFVFFKKFENEKNIDYLYLFFSDNTNCIETKLTLKHIVLWYKIDDKNYLAIHFLIAVVGFFIYKLYYMYISEQSFIQMLATINTPKVQAPFGVSLLHSVLIIQGYNQNYRVHEIYTT